MDTAKIYIHKDVHQALRMTIKTIDTGPTVLNTGEKFRE